MSVVVITGSAGLVGSEAAKFFSSIGMLVVGIDNDMRATFFGKEASTNWVKTRLQQTLRGYRHFSLDIRNAKEIDALFASFGTDISLVIHAAAQPSHDWAASDPPVDFGVNAVGTSNLLQATIKNAPEAVFIYMSTNKVYGDRPNYLPLVEQEHRWEIDPAHPYREGIPESMSVDDTTHSLFGVSKLSADLLVQEYGRYFGLKTACFRGGCLTGPNHSGAQLHGFLSYLVRCHVEDNVYNVIGYKGKQVRDNIHSADLVRAFHEFYKAPRAGEIYNMGGGRSSNCSVLEAIQVCEQLSGREMKTRYVDTNRKGDHIWWISDYSRFQSHYPDWKITYNVPAILNEIYQATVDRQIPLAEVS
ncbi:MAG TPA: NAD-dependent epimerase/dehydratase family protein [Terriglobales bacterium]|jgi:CDP-paratose 2-epimerase|nr:NAD-dependent epimerase/dehydratase family protein [Terriglobales bacterium]